METSNQTFSAAKLREFVKGEIKENNDLYQHTGIVSPESKSQEMLSFLEGIYDNRRENLPHDLEATKAATTIRRSAASRYVGKSIEDTPSYAVGMTEQEVEIAPAKAFSKIQNSILNNQAPYIGCMFGHPNAGKTNFGLLYLELWKELVDQKYDSDLKPVIISNARSLKPKYTVTGIRSLVELVFGSEEYFESDGAKGTPPEIDENRPKFLFFDECSTHLDARKFGYEVANQYLPWVKRFAKVNLDALHIGHSGMDIHKDLRRSTISTEFIFKRDLKVADVYSSMDDDQGSDKKYRLEAIPETSIPYDPDDFSPWRWE